MESHAWQKLTWCDESLLLKIRRTVVLSRCSVNSSPQLVGTWTLSTQKDRWLLVAKVELGIWKGSRVLVPELGVWNTPRSCVSLLPAVDPDLATTLIDGLSLDTWRYPVEPLQNVKAKQCRNDDPVPSNHAVSHLEMSVRMPLGGKVLGLLPLDISLAIPFHNMS